MQFIVEAYQLFKARACGADAVLLIAAVLPNNDLAYLIKSVRKLGMQTLIEVTILPIENNLSLLYTSIYKQSPHYSRTTD